MFENIYNDLLKEALNTINNSLPLQRTNWIPNGRDSEVAAIDNDDAWILIQQEDGMPKLRGKREQRHRERLLNEGASIPAEDPADAPLTKNLSAEDIFRLADSLYNTMQDKHSPREHIPNLDGLYKKTVDFVGEHQGEDGYIDTQDDGMDTIYSIEYYDTDFHAHEMRVHGVRVRNGELQILSDTDTTGLTKIEYEREDFMTDNDWQSVRYSNIDYVATLFSIAESIDQYILPNATPAEPGSVIHGTMRNQDVIPALMETLKRCDPKTAKRLLDNNKKLKQALRSGDGNDPWWDGEEATMLLNEDIFDAMQGIAPKGHLFGSHPGDGSDYGFWPDEQDNTPDTVEDEDNPYMKTALLLKDLVEETLPGRTEIPAGELGFTGTAEGGCATLLKDAEGNRAVLLHWPFYGDWCRAVTIPENEFDDPNRVCEAIEHFYED